MAATANATALRNSSSSWTLRYSPSRVEITSAMPAMTRIWFVSRSSCLVSGVFSTAVAWSMPLMWPTSVAMPVVVTRMVPAPRVTWQFMNAMSTRSPRAASAATASTCLGVGTLSPVSADSSISRVAAERMRASAGTRSPASMFTMSPGTSSSMGTSTSSPSRRTFDLTTIILDRAEALASALPSWFIAIQALNRVSRMRNTPVKNWPGRNRQTMPAMRSTICIGSAYWRLKVCQFEAFFASSKVFLPYLARRASTSADDRPTAGSTVRRLATSSGARACHETSGAGVAAGRRAGRRGHASCPFGCCIPALRRTRSSAIAGPSLAWRQCGVVYLIAGRSKPVTMGQARHVSTSILPTAGGRLTSSTGRRRADSPV